VSETSIRGADQVIVPSLLHAAACHITRTGEG